MRDHMKLIRGVSQGQCRVLLAVLVSLIAITLAACIADRPPSAPTPISRPMPRNPARPHHQPVVGNTTAAPSEALPEASAASSEMPAGQSEARAEERAQTALAGPSPAELIGLNEQRATDLL